MGLWDAIGKSVDNTINLAGSLYQQREDYKNSKKLMDYQNQLNIQNWHMQNAYNAPSAQMARYKEAGLNPNLIYGQSNESGSISSVGIGNFHGRMPDLSVFSPWLEMSQIRADVKNKQAQNSLLNSQADYVKEQVKSQALDNALKRQTLKSIGPNGNPNDPYWYRDIKKNNPLNPVMRWIGSEVGQTEAARPWTVRVNGREYTAVTNDDALRLLNRENSRLHLRKDRGK